MAWSQPSLNQLGAVKNLTSYFKGVHTFTVHLFFSVHSIIGPLLEGALIHVIGGCTVFGCVSAMAFSIHDTLLTHGVMESICL